MYAIKNEPCMPRPAVIDLNPVKCNYYPFVISLDKCNGNCNKAIDDFSGKVCVPSKTEGVNVKVFNMMAKINETKVLVKHLSCDCKCKIDSKACNISQKWNNETCQCEC